jgi:hypothetical protein
LGSSLQLNDVSLGFIWRGLDMQNEFIDDCLDTQNVEEGVSLQLDSTASLHGALEAPSGL